MLTEIWIFFLNLNPYHYYNCRSNSIRLSSSLIKAGLISLKFGTNILSKIPIEKRLAHLRRQPCQFNIILADPSDVLL